MDIQYDHLVLIYHGFRGLAQPIRMLFTILRLPFEQRFISADQHQELCLEKTTLKKKTPKNTNQNLYPALHHENRVIYEVQPIMTYLCKRFERQDLLGRSVEDQSLVCQLFTNWTEKKSKIFTIIFQLMNRYTADPANVKEQRRQIILQLIENSHFYEQCHFYFMRTKGFLMGYFTVVDLLFYDLAFYIINLFGNLESQPFLRVIKQVFTSVNQAAEQTLIQSYLRATRQFKINIESQDFYAYNKDYLESFSVICFTMPPQLVQAYKKLWLGDRKVLDYPRVSP